MLEAKRTLVKSGPELWAEVSDQTALASLLSAFGEDIRITRTADSSLVEWEGERAVGRLALEPSGFGTRVVMTAELAPVPEPPAPAPAPAPTARQGFFARLRRRPAPTPPAPAPTPKVVPVMGEDEALEALTKTLDHLGTAHHRPFSR